MREVLISYENWRGEVSLVKTSSWTQNRGLFEVVFKTEDGVEGTVYRAKSKYMKPALKFFLESFIPEIFNNPNIEIRKKHKNI